MTLASRIAARSRRPTATVRVGGARWPGVLSLSRAQSFGGGISGGEVVGRDPPVTIAEGETTISWTWGYDGFEVAGFNGVVSRILQRSYPNQWRLQVADPLWLADIRRKDIATSPLNNIAASTAIAQILSAAGLTRVSIPTLAASGSAWAGAEWIMGTLTPVAFANTTALAAATQIAQTLGYWLYCDASGTVRAALLERRPSDSPTRTLRWGEDFLLAGPPERERDASQVKNRVVVRGANTGVQGAQISDAWQTGDADRSLEATYSLIEYVNESQAGNASCTAAATRLLRLWSRQPNVIRIGKIKADPRLAVGQTVAVQCANIGYSAATAFFVYSLDTKLDLRSGDFSQSLVLDGGTGDGGYTTVPPPEAAFSWRLVAETLNGVGVVEVFLDGSGSTSFGGAVVSWAWSSATAVASGYSATASGVRAMFVYPAATATASITLTVTDTSSKTGSLTQVVTLAGDATSPLTSRVISLALGSAWAATADGGATWATAAAATGYTLVPESGGSGLLASDGAALKASADALATAPTTAATLGGTITALSVTDGAPLRVWAAVGAALSRSIDGGATWAAWGTLPAAITAILEDPAVLNSVFVLAGADLYHSTLDTPGTGWATLYAGPSGATARHLVRGASGATTWICYTGTFVGSPLQRVEGPISATFPVVSPDVTEIRALALSDDETTVYAWDAQGRGWGVDSATGIATALTATLGAGETAQHALCDPDDPIVYLATFGATAGTTYKYLPLADTLAAFYVPAAGQQAHRVGLGAPALPTVELLILTDGATPGGVWHNGSGSWALKNGGLPSGWRWLYIAVSPFSPNDWLLLGAAAGGCTRSGGRIVSSGYSPLWRTTDAGAGWAEVDMADDGTPTEVYDPFNTNNLQPIGYTSTGDLFVFGNYGSGFASTVALWRGTGAGLSRTLLTTTGGGRGAHSAAAGQDGDLVLGYATGGVDYTGYIVAGGSAWSNVAAESATMRYARSSLGRGVIAQGSGGTSVYADYRSSAQLTGAEAALYVALCRGAAYLAGGRSGVYAIPAPFSAPGTGAVVAATGLATNVVAADPTQTAVAALVGDAAALTIYASADGATWASTAGPTGGNLRPAALGVITR